MNVRVGPVVRAAFDRLIDYAGLFPPAALGMEEAVAEYAAARRSDAAWMLGRFIVPASRLVEFARTWVAQPEEAPLSVIVDASRHPREWFGSLQGVLSAVARARDSAARRIEVLEIPLPPLASARETFDAAIGQLRASLDRSGAHGLPAYVELPRDARWLGLLPGAMLALARMRLGAKIRCGGVSPEAFPSVDDVACFIRTAGDHGVAFKATAGLHHPLRHLDAATGFTMHGFLNLLAAATFAPHADAETLRRIVAEEDPQAFTIDQAGLSWRDLRAGEREVARARATAFVGYGSCSFSEPVEDLTAVRMLPAQCL